MDRFIRVSVPSSNEPLAKSGSESKRNQQPTSWAGTSLPYLTTTVAVSVTHELLNKLWRGSGTISEATRLKSPVVADLPRDTFSGLRKAEGVRGHRSVSRQLEDHF